MPVPACPGLPEPIRYGRVVQHERDRSFQHPAVSAALSARNAVAAEMAMAARAGNDPADACWSGACAALRHPGDSPWLLASDAYARMRDDLSSLDAIDAVPVGDHAPALSALAVPVAGAGQGAAAAPDAPAARQVRKPVARRRRERLETATWFAVGGAGGLLLACAVRAIETVVLWR